MRRCTRTAPHAAAAALAWTMLAAQARAESWPAPSPEWLERGPGGGLFLVPLFYVLVRRMAGGGRHDASESQDLTEVTP